MNGMVDRRNTVLGLTVVALTVCLLGLAATGPGSVGRPDRTARVMLDQRVFSCTGGLPGTTLTAGSVLDGLMPAANVTGAPARIQFDIRLAQGAFAGQSAHHGAALSWLPCPEPEARWWFVGAGAAVTHDSVVTISNPRSGAAVVDMDVFGPSGPVQAPGLHGITVPSGQSRSIDLAKSAPAVGDLAVRLLVRRGLVAASVVDRFSPGVIGKTVGEWLPPQPGPTTSLTLAGLPPSPSAAMLIVVNPAQVASVAKVQVIGARGTFTPEGTATLTIPPASVARIPLGGIVDATPMAIRVTADQPVTATIRSTRSADVAFATGVQPILGATAFAVPAGAGRLVLSSIGAASKVALVAFDARGRRVVDRTVSIPTGSSVAVALTGVMRYLQLTGEVALTVAGFEVIGVGGNSGVATGGVAPAIRSIRLPLVSPGW